MNGAIEKLAISRLIERSADLEVQLEKGVGTAPVVNLLAKAREAAASALFSLVMVDPTETAKVQQYQNEVRRYDDLVAFVREVIIEGKEADRRLIEAEREEFDDIINSPEVRREQALGGSDKGFDA